MDLKVLINQCSLAETGNFFVVVQIDELLYEEKKKKTQKFRTELQLNTSNPHFRKNVFLFENLSFGSKLTFKLGCFSSRLMSEPQDVKILFDHSVLKGSCQLTLTVKLLEQLRIEGTLQNDLILYYDENVQSELGRIQLTFRHKSHDLTAQIDDDIDRIEKLYYDPYETDREVVFQKLEKIKKRLVKKQEELGLIQNKWAFIRTAHKNVSYDQAKLRNQKEALEMENGQMRKIVDKKNDVKELHIMVDLLKNTDQGQDILKRKLVLLLNKLEFERTLYNDLSNHYFSVEPSLNESKQIEKDISTTRESIQEQDFLIKRCQDQLPQVKNLIDTIKNQEGLIENLQNQIKEITKQQTKLDNQELKYNLEKLRADRKILAEKQKQLQGVREMNKGNLPLDIFEKFQKDSYIQDNPNLIIKFRKRSEMLLKEIEMIQNEMDKQSLQSDMQKYQKPNREDNSDVNILQLELEQADNKCEILQEQVDKNKLFKYIQMISITKNYAYQIAELKSQLNQIESQIMIREGNSLLSKYSQ